MEMLPDHKLQAKETWIFHTSLLPESAEPVLLSSLMLENLSTWTYNYLLEINTEIKSQEFNIL